MTYNLALKSIPIEVWIIQIIKCSQKLKKEKDYLHNIKNESIKYLINKKIMKRFIEDKIDKKK